MSRPIPKHQFHFRAVGHGLRMYEDTKWHIVISNLKHFWVDILFFYIESTDENSRLISKVYNKMVIEFIL